jgi:dTDP-glucose pyrophosphorylase/CBS domain-containing protein
MRLLRPMISKVTDSTSLLIGEHTPIKQALLSMDRGGEGFLVVQSDDGRVIGVVADGDVRRALIAGTVLDAPVSELMNRDFKFASTNESRENAVAYLKTLKCRQLPILDGRARLVDVIFSDHLDTPRRENPVVIMAGGLGSRLRPMTETVPKPMLRAGEKPFLERILDNLVEQGFHDFHFCVHYLADQIVDYFQDGSKWGVEIQYLYEEKPLGTAGALAMLRPSGALPFLVMNGDLVTKLDFGAMLAHHAVQEHLATVGVRTMDIQVPFGVVQTDGTRVVGIAEKPVHSFLVSAGIYVVDPQCLSHIRAGDAVDMPTLLDELARTEKGVGHFPIYETWIDIGRMEDYQRAVRIYTKTNDD